MSAASAPACRFRSTAPPYVGATLWSLSAIRAAIGDATARRDIPCSVTAGTVPRREPEATCGTIRLKLLKIGALVRVSVRRIKIAMASACPYRNEFALAHLRLAAVAR